MEKRFTTHGYPSWMELMTTDMDGAKKFYSEVFDWQFDEYPSDSDMKYYTISVKGEEETPFGGIFDKKEAIGDMSQVPPHWANYITVSDIETSLKKVEQLGGNIIVPKTDIPKIGMFSVIQDPQGAVISMMQYLEEQGDC